MPMQSKRTGLLAPISKIQCFLLTGAIAVLVATIILVANAATPLHAAQVSIAAALSFMVGFILNRGPALLTSRISAHNKLPGYNQLAALPASPTTVCLYFSKPEGIIKQVGLHAYLSAVGDLGLRIQRLVGSTVYHIESGTLLYQSERSQYTEIEVVRNLINQTGSIFVGGKDVDLRLYAGICLSERLGLEDSVVQAIIAAKESHDLRKPFCIWGDNPAKSPFTLSVITEFERSLAQGQVWLAYQPKHDVTTRVVSGAEALIRWDHPEHGAIPPDHFIPLLEAAGRMESLTSYTINQALKDFSIADADLDIAINIAPSMLGSGAVLRMIESALERYRFPATRLIIEITETDVVSEDQIDELHQLRKIGVGVAIDDYGAGYSTVGHLKRLPATQIKIDRSLVSQVLADQKNRLIISSSIRLAHEMGMKVVAEGAEAEAQCEFLRTAGCDLVQGYILGKPMPIEEFRLSLLRDEQSVAA